MAAAVPKANPPPDTVLFAAVPKLKEFVTPGVPVTVAVGVGVGVGVPKENPPPGAAGVELVIPKVVPVAAAVVF